MNSGKLGVALAGGLLLTGCATSNPFSNIPVEDRSSGAAAVQQPVQTEPSGVVVTPMDPGLGVRPLEVEPIVRAQREILPPADEVWQPSPVTPTAPASSPSAPSPAESPASVDNAAVVALLDTAKQETAQGDLRAAQTRLERAQRIAPREPEVYYQLADVKRQLGQFMDAEQVALRGIDVASGQNASLRRLWALISQIRTEAGDLAGADDARQQASRY
ncbi:TPR repeat protein [Nitrincola lacisaponensis]|uniref:TPR repeat protein n=1 Tax=Nitrincola lacisaponensis TaxID=267850 RepID=A0A063XYY1_9GAMM|nr:tetratricopeptide repeat protein [Nitrincola lacisaponensis]KDE38699.1 TPR repeat protein [Nitrincola lacisaponensis]